MRIEIDIPTKLSEITLDQYRRYLKLAESNTEGQHKDRFLALKMLEIFCNVPYKTGMQLKMSDVNRAIDHLISLLNSNPDLVMQFEIGDTKFGFIPKLDDMTFGEFIDLDKSMGDWDKMHQAMAVLYRPIKKQIGQFYSIQEYRGDNFHEAMMLTPLDAVFSSIVFFYNLGIDLSKLTVNYMREDQNSQQDLQQGLAESGGGINQFTHSLKEMLDGLKISQE